MSYNAFYPGKVWLDTEGKWIQAHGGSVFYLDGTYYWYGETVPVFMDQFYYIWKIYGLSRGIKLFYFILEGYRLTADRDP